MKNVIQRFLKDLVSKYIVYVIFLATCGLFTYLSKIIPYFAPLSNFVKVASVIVIFFTIFALYKLYAKTKSNAKLIKNSGLFLFQPNRKSGDIEANRILMEEKSSTARDIFILGATGYNTFARSDAESKAMLREQLERMTGEIKIMLLHPKAQQAEIRAISLGEPIERYQQDILTSIDFLRQLKNKGQNISLKVYVQRPIWKMILLDDFLWLQYYHPNSHVEQMPVYGIYRKQQIGEYSLFGPLYEVFQKKWNSDNNPTVDLSSDIIPVHPHDPLTGIGANNKIIDNNKK